MGKGLPHSLQHSGLDKVKVQTFVLNETIAITGGAGVVDPGESVITGSLPEGNLLTLGAVANVTVDGTDADVLIDWAGDFGIGTVPNADADLADAGEDDLIPSTALVADTGLKVTLVTRGVSTQTEQSVILDNTGSTLELNFNLLVDDNFITDAAVGTFTVTGALYLALIVLGDD